MDEKLPPHIIGPAPKEEGMEPKLDRWIPCKNRSCTEERYGTGEPILCNICIKKQTAELHAVWEKAYFAALTGCCSDPKVIDVADEAALAANATVAAWPSMTAERDALIAKAVQG